jgi:tryptophanyl-tRNA synthetase
MKKTLVSGIQASGTLHIGNYFGAMRQNITIGNDDAYDAYVFIANYHAMTTQKDPKALLKSSFDIACAYLACGLDPEKVSLFRQSSVPEVNELTWIFNTVTSMPYLMRAHAFKDQEAKNKDVNVGLFDYPVLMAADILIYGGELVPVGQDQKQHIEYARDIAGYFNREWKELFKLPKDYIAKDVAVVPGTDGAKMSKSKGNVIPLFGTDAEIKKAVMGIVTDSKTPDEKKDPDTNNIYNIHRLFLTKDEDAKLRSKYQEGGLSYKDAKEGLLHAILHFVTPMREKYEHYQSHPAEVEAILEQGGRKAKEKAEATMKAVRKAVGLDA